MMAKLNSKIVEKCLLRSFCAMFFLNVRQKTNHSVLRESRSDVCENKITIRTFLETSVYDLRIVFSANLFYLTSELGFTRTYTSGKSGKR